MLNRKWRHGGLRNGTYEESGVLREGLEATVTELAARVDELELDLLEGDTFRVCQQRLAQGQHALLRSHAAAANHDEVVAVAAFNFSASTLFN